MVKLRNFVDVILSLIGIEWWQTKLEIIVNLNQCLREESVGFYFLSNVE